MSDELMLAETTAIRTEREAKAALTAAIEAAHDAGRELERQAWVAEKHWFDIGTLRGELVVNCWGESLDEEPISEWFRAIISEQCLQIEQGKDESFGLFLAAELQAAAERVLAATKKAQAQ